MKSFEKEYYVVTKYGGVFKRMLRQVMAQGKPVYRDQLGTTYAPRQVYELDKFPPHLMTEYERQRAERLETDRLLEIAKNHKETAI